METKITLPPGTKVPNHIAIIPDGNRRWAKERGLPTLEGHRKGSEVFIKVGRAARDLGVHTITIWGFSTENWNRADIEIKYLMNLFEDFLDKHLPEIKKEGAKFIHLGRKDRLSKSLLKKLKSAEETTKNNTKYILNLALDYGGHDELLRAMEKAIKDILDKKITVEKLKEEVGKYQEKFPYYFFKHYLDTGDQPYPYPDLIIRTSNEKRTSGLMSWQACYAELYWEPDHFPDFTPEKLREAIIDYSNRDRRFGGNTAGAKP